MPTSVIFRVFVLLLLSSFLATNTQAQRDNDVMVPGSVFEISGQVRSGDNKTVENVMIRIETHAGALVDQGTTDSMGRFRFTRLRSGQYRVMAKVGDANFSRSTRRPLSFKPARTRVTSTCKGGSRLLRRPERSEVIDARVPSAANTAFEKGTCKPRRKKFRCSNRALQKGD